MVKIPFLPSKADFPKARGRNGWFRPRNIYVYRANDVLCISVQSRRIGTDSPVVLQLAQSDARALARAITHEVGPWY